MWALLFICLSRLFLFLFVQPIPSFIFYELFNLFPIFSVRLNACIAIHPSIQLKCDTVFNDSTVYSNTFPIQQCVKLAHAFPYTWLFNCSHQFYILLIRWKKIGARNFLYVIELTNLQFCILLKTENFSYYAISSSVSAVIVGQNRICIEDWTSVFFVCANALYISNQYRCSLKCDFPTLNKDNLDKLVHKRQKLKPLYLHEHLWMAHVPLFTLLVVIFFFLILRAILLNELWNVEMVSDWSWHTWNTLCLRFIGMHHFSSTKMEWTAAFKATIKSIAKRS